MAIISANSYSLSYGLRVLHNNFGFTWLLPLVILLVHVFLMKKDWKKSRKSFKIITGTSLVLFLIVLSVTFLETFKVGYGEEAAWEFILFVWPVAVAIVLGWLIRYLITKMNNRKA